MRLRGDILFLFFLCSIQMSHSTTTVQILDPNITFSAAANGSAGYFPKFFNTTSLVISNIFQNGLYVGINSTNPTTLLDVRGTVRALHLMVDQGAEIDEINPEGFDADEPLRIRGYRDIVLYNNTIVGQNLTVGYGTDLEFTPQEIDGISIQVSGGINLTGLVNLTKLCFGNIGCMSSPASGSGNPFDQNLNTTDFVQFEGIGLKTSGASNSRIRAVAQNKQDGLLSFYDPTGTFLVDWETESDAGINTTILYLMKQPTNDYNIRLSSNTNSCINCLQGNLSIGADNAAIDFGYRLSVNGTVNVTQTVNATSFITQNVTINNTGMYWLQGTSCKNRMFFNGTHMVFNGNC